MTTILLAVLSTLLVAECTHGVDRLAHLLIGWANRLAHGRSPRAQVRVLEQVGDLEDCHSQITKLLFALKLLAQGLVDWTVRVSGRSSSFAGAGTDCLHRAASEALALALRDVDLRGMKPPRRGAVRRHVAQLHALLERRAESFDSESSAALLAATASACEAYIADRDEVTAVHLAQAAAPHVELRRRDPAVFPVRRAHAHALLQLGQRDLADALLADLNADEEQLYGPDNVRTLATRHLRYWALVLTNQLTAGERGLRTIESRLLTTGGDNVLLRHVQCKLSWAVGRQPGRVPEAAHDYENVIRNRVREYGADNGDTLDARHSLGKSHVLAGDGARAHAVLFALLADRSRVEGPDHPDTLETRKYLALADTLRRPLHPRVTRRAIRELRRVLRKQVRRLPPAHPDVHDTRQWLATLANTLESQ